MSHPYAHKSVRRYEVSSVNRTGSGFEVWFRFSLDISEFGAIGRDERDSGVTGK